MLGSNLGRDCVDSHGMDSDGVHSSRRSPSRKQAPRARVHAMAIYLPLLPIDTVRLHERRLQDRSTTKLRSQALVLVRSHAQQQLVAACCEHALRAGVRVGCSVSDARAVLAPQSRFKEHDPAVDMQMLRKLARWAMKRFSPIVALDAAMQPAGLMLNIAGCAHLFGGEEAMLARVLRDFSSKGFCARGATAASYACARAVAQFGSQRMCVVHDGCAAQVATALPIAALHVEPAFEQALAEIGIETLGQLALLPRASVAARFGHGVLAALDACMGVQSQHEFLDALAHRVPLVASHALAGPCAQLQALSQLVQQLLAQLCEQLAHKDSGVRKLEVVLTRADMPPTSLSLALSMPTRDAKHLWSLLAPHFEKVNLGHGVEKLSVLASWSQRVAHRQHELAAAAHAARHDASIAHSTLESTAATLIDTLCSRLGSHHVLQGVVNDCHQIDRAIAMQQIGTLAQHRFAKRTLAAHASQQLAKRPAIVFDEAIPAKVSLLSPDGPVLWVQWHGMSDRIVWCVGPERICGAWWLASKHAAAKDFDYFIACDARGRWLWLRHELASSEGAHAWAVAGVW